MTDIHILSSLKEIAREQWDRCFPGELEGYDYLLAVEEAAIAGFAWRYVTAWEGKKMVAGVPAFLNDYALDTTLQGVGKKVTTLLRAALPNLLTIKLACLGSPCTEAGVAGFSDDMAMADRAKLLTRMVAAFEEYGQQQGYKLFGIKDIPEAAQPLWQACLNEQGYASITSLPTAYLDIDFTTEEEYLAQLSAVSRKNMRRKLRATQNVRIEFSDEVNAYLPQIMALYKATKERSDWQFEELTEAFFSGVLAHMQGRSSCALYYVGQELLAANLLLHDGHTLIDKFFCMGARGREHNLYFLSWFTNVRYCLEHGLKRYQSGQEGYENKLRLGSKLTHNQMHFKHRSSIAQTVLKWVSPLLAVDEHMAHKEAA